MKFDMKAIGERVARARFRACKSTLVLAESARITQAELCQIESGDADPCLSTIFALADALGVSVAWLVGEVS